MQNGGLSYTQCGRRAPSRISGDMRIRTHVVCTSSQDLTFKSSITSTQVWPDQTQINSAEFTSIFRRSRVPLKPGSFSPDQAHNGSDTFTSSTGEAQTCSRSVI